MGTPVDGMGAFLVPVEKGVRAVGVPMEKRHGMGPSSRCNTPEAHGGGHGGL